MFLKKILFDNLNVNSDKFGQATIIYEHKHIKPKEWLRRFSKGHYHHKNNLRNYLEKANEFLERFHRLVSSFHTYNIHFFSKSGRQYASI